ncbi:glucose 1-dehydrogenase [Ktedonosporobacter rubrisoli]|uniref:Glucose 1-dehydrogenase n=1 Tax=Ktedonosporobacter rubrisoli TaxID=2509675 RepID=A0A4V0YY05_KTERU|nr:glucose 1-dehydrogenase [Ktedonosporobacter rubrisoli]QBD74541.1 glucose 1-dehydrogenase [Ktedonosporobacter rubrisoli]
MHRLEGKIALVVGASKGIGLAAARTFAQEGSTVVLAARHIDEKIVEEIKASGAEALAIATDVTDETSVEHLVSATLETYGRLDIAFNNAGVNAARHPLAEVSIEEYEQTLAVNLKGVFLAMKHEIRAMLQSGGGAIVNTSSVAGLVANYSIGPYVASKHGVIGLTKAAALDYAKHNIRVNAIAPGPTQTEMFQDRQAHEPGVRERLEQATPMGRMADPMEIVWPAVWLCSDEASYITGTVIPIDGGRLAF